MDSNSQPTCTPGAFGRLAALCYDLVLLFGVLMVAVAFLVIPYDFIVGVPFPYDEGFHRFGLRLYLVTVIGLLCESRS